MSYSEQHLSRNKETAYPQQLVACLVKKFSLGRDSLVVDFGCGRGGYTKAWLEAEFSVVALDLEKSFEGAVAVDLTAPQKFEGKADVVFSKSVVEHLPSMTVFLENAHRALGKGGLLLVFTPDWKTCMAVFYDDYTHVRPYTEVSLYEVVDKGNWGNVRVERFWQVGFAFKHPLVFRYFRWCRWLLPQGDLRRRMTHMALMLSARAK